MKIYNDALSGHLQKVRVGDKWVQIHIQRVALEKESACNTALV